jgi:Tol biopolymer transport system component
MADLRVRLRILDDAPVPEQWDEIRRRPAGPEVQARSGTARRATAALVGLVVALAGTVFAVDRLMPGPEASTLDMTAWAPARVEALELAFRYPPAWHVQPFDELVGHAGFAGAVVSNVDHTFRHPDLGPTEFTSAWVLRDLPDHAVVLSIERVDAIAVPERRADTPLPLSLSDGRRQDAYRPGPAWTHLWLPFVLDGRHDSVRVWFGPDASERDREVARRIVASIAPIATPGPTGEERIVFGTLPWPDIAAQVFTMKPDGSDIEQITEPDADYLSPALSPDGASIAFVRFTQGSDPPTTMHEGIFVMNADGSDPRELLETGEPMPISVGQIAWSPDGSLIGFVRNIYTEGSEADSGYELWVMGADGSDPHRLTDRKIVSFAWSPDGRRIAFTEETADGARLRWDLHVMDADGANARSLTADGRSSFPAWSPDGERIAYQRWEGGGVTHVYVLEPDRQEVDPRPVWTGDAGIDSLDWSPDGSRIVFDAYEQEQKRCSIMTVTVDGDATTLLEAQRLEVMPGEPPPERSLCAGTVTWGIVSASD